MLERQSRLVMHCSRSLSLHHCRYFSVLNRPAPKYDRHVPLTPVEKVALGIGSALGAFFYPRRADLVGILGEVTAGPFLARLRNTMLADETGRRILRDQPRITPQALPLDILRNYPENTVGRLYANFCDRYRLSQARDRVRYIDDEECAFVMQRYRECHDLYHAIFGLPPSFVEAELALKAFEFISTGLPMTALSLFAVTRLKHEEKNRFFQIYLPWAMRSARSSKAIINVYWEKELHVDRDILLSGLGLERPPDLYKLRQRARMIKGCRM